MRKVIKQETFEYTFNTPDLYTRLTFEDGEVRWVTRVGVAHEKMQQPLENEYLKIRIKQ